MLPWKLQKRQILPVNQNLSSVHFSLAKFQPVSCNLSLAIIWQMTYTHKLPKLCSAALTLQTLNLEVGNASLAYHGVSLNKELYSTLSLFPQVYKWVPVTYGWGVTLKRTSIPSRCHKQYSYSYFILKKQG